MGRREQATSGNIRHLGVNQEKILNREGKDMKLWLAFNSESPRGLFEHSRISSDLILIEGVITADQHSGAHTDSYSNTVTENISISMGKIVFLANSSNE